MDKNQKNICHECVGDEFLKTQIRKEGKRHNCAYCNKSRKAVSLKWLAEAVHETIEQHFSVTPDQPSELEYSLLRNKELRYGWDRRGDPVNSIIQDIAKIDETIASDVQGYLSDEYDHGSTKDYGEEDPFGDEVHYEESGSDDQRFQESWNIFRQEVTSRARFFSQTAENVLGKLFNDLYSLKTFDGESIVKVLGPNSKERFLYRARVSQSQLSLEKILKDPVNKLGAPNSRIASSGRMNAAGISVFYGATEPETCIAEIRPPVGSHIVLGRFEIIQDIRLLDFDLLTKVYVLGSYFDPVYKTQLERAAFLKRLIGELIKPVMPDDEIFEYLPTQIIAEFLSEKIDPRIDGVIFKSSQTGEGKNIVLFNHSCRTEPYTLPSSTTVSINFGWATEDDYDDSITVFEELPKKNESPSEKDSDKRSSQLSMMDLSFDDAEIDFEYIDTREVTLRLDVDNIEVKKIKWVKYDPENRYISRHRFNKKDDADSDF